MSSDVDWPSALAKRPPVSLRADLRDGLCYEVRLAEHSQHPFPLYLAGILENSLLVDFFFNSL